MSYIYFRHLTKTKVIYTTEKVGAQLFITEQSAVEMLDKIYEQTGEDGEIEPFGKYFIIKQRV